nr:MAG TPA: tail protein [Caudoviricetes sp.]
MGKNKIIYGGNVLIDLTVDTVTKENVLVGYKFHGPDGEEYTGTCKFDLDTSGATAKVAEVLAGKTFGAGGTMQTGTMKNNGAVTGTIKTKSQVYTIPVGYHDGSGNVSIDATEAAKIIASNIKSGIEILGVTGSYSGESIKATAVNVTPYTTEQTILPPSGSDYISQVTVAAIYYNESENTAGGTTVTIGTVAPS